MMAAGSFLGDRVFSQSCSCSCTFGKERLWIGFIKWYRYFQVFSSSLPIQQCQFVKVLCGTQYYINFHLKLVIVICIMR